MRPATAKRHGTGTLILFLCILLSLVLSGIAGAAEFPPEKDTTTGMVMSSHPIANQVGKAVLDKGGNAVDAAVAVGYALSVLHPSAGNIGGGGFAVIHLANGENVVLDFREKAPYKADKDMYLDKDGNVIPDASTLGYLAAGVPGSVAGMCAMLDRYGTKKLPEIIAPSIALADKGFKISGRQEESMAEAAPRFAKFASSRKYFLKPDGSSYKEGDLFVQKDLAKVLRAISQKGPDGFYSGPVAAMIAKDMADNGGIITEKDLADYDVKWRKPVMGTYRGYEIISMSPPSSGGVHVVQILNVMENADIKKLGFGSSQTVHIMAEAMRQAYADRSEYLGDTDFVPVPVEKLMSKEYAKSIYSRILPDKATPSKDVKPGLPKEGNNTTHYSVVDKAGNAVSVTYTINDSYGSAAAVMGCGFLLNNEMDDFSAKAGVPNIYGLVGSDANRIEPLKRPLSSMSPTIILKDGKLFMVLGSPGGARIITTVLQVISNVIDHGMNIREAVCAPRFHMQWLPDEIRYEPGGMVKDVYDKLTAMGYTLAEKPVMGDVNAIMVDWKKGVMYGTGDPRAEF